MLENKRRKKIKGKKREEEKRNGKWGKKGPEQGYFLETTNSSHPTYPTSPLSSSYDWYVSHFQL